MSDGIIAVWRFETASGASPARDLVEQRPRAAGLPDSLDAAVVTWPAGVNGPRTLRVAGSSDAGSHGISLWDTVFGVIFFVPLLNAATATAPHTTMDGALATIGLDMAFVNRVRDEVIPGTSALFLVSSAPVIDEMTDTFGRLDDSGRIIHRAPVCYELLRLLDGDGAS